jgi:hypothetical protein
MWSFTGEPAMEKNARIAAGPLGRFLYRWANLSLRVILPSAYGDKSKLTPQIHRQYLERFPDRWSRGVVLWTLAKSLIGSSQYYNSLWEQRDRPSSYGRCRIPLFDRTSLPVGKKCCVQQGRWKWKVLVTGHTKKHRSA